MGKNGYGNLLSHGSRAFVSIVLRLPVVTTTDTYKYEHARFASWQHPNSYDRDAQCLGQYLRE